QRSEPDALARLWAHRMRSLLSAPLLTASTPKAVVPVGETRTITFGGLLRFPERASAPGDVVSVVLHGSEARALLTGRTPGDARLTFEREGAAVTVEVAVRPYAGSFPAEAEAFVTGNPAPSDLIERVAREAATKVVRLEPGATADVGKAWGAAALRPGHHIRVPVAVRVEGPGCLPRAGRVAVTVTNLRLRPAAKPVLFYSNHPERVKGYGSLFFGQLPPGRPARLLYHHQNALGRAFLFSVDLVNPFEDPVRLHVTEGEALPSRDPIEAGQQAARRFLRNQGVGAGYVVDLPPRSVTPVVHRLVRPWQVVSGLFALRQLGEGEGCYVHVRVDDPDEPFVRPPDAGEPPSPTIFETAYRPLEVHYTVGGPWAFVRLGSPPQAGESRLSEHGFGDYGVTYDIVLHLHNPSPQPERVGLVLEAASGQARALIVLDGKVVQTRTLSAHEEVVLAVYTLPPGANRSVSIRTLPLSGSAYPVRLVARTLPAAVALGVGSTLHPH
ncbi:MAG: hypothetical protein QHJ73_16655, partial [Armatimonadota bacterium]|nr:hypothetical protein [Armatimonadota bacterium]